METPMKERNIFIENRGTVNDLDIGLKEIVKG
jgi:hypothetical protein